MDVIDPFLWFRYKDFSSHETEAQANEVELDLLPCLETKRVN